MVIERPSILDELGRRLAHCNISSGDGAGQHNSWKRLPTVSSGLAFNDPARLRLGLTYVRLISPSLSAKGMHWSNVRDFQHKLLPRKAAKSIKCIESISPCGTLKAND